MQDEKPIQIKKEALKNSSNALSDSQQQFARRTSSRNRVKSQKADVQEDSGSTRPRRNLHKE